MRFVTLLYVLSIINLKYTFEKHKWKRLNISRRSSVIIKEWEIRYKQGLQYAKKKGLPLASKEALLQYKTSDTLFILGSGPSINDISVSQWAGISQCDSVGFNFFLVNHHVPTYYSIELRESYADIFFKCYKARDERFQQVPMLITLYDLIQMPDQREREIFNTIEEAYVVIPKMFKGADKTNLTEILNYYYFNKDQSDGLLIHYRASLIKLITLGILLDYRTIVLAGFDMDSSDYFFFDDKKYNNETDRLLREMEMNNARIVQAKNKGSSSPHRTIDPEAFKEIPLDQAVLVFNDLVLKPMGIALYLFSDKSLLYPSLDIYPHSVNP